LFGESSISLPISQSGVELQLKITANSTYWEANLISYDLVAKDRKKRLFSGIFEQSQIRPLYQQILFPGKMIYSEPDTGSDCQGCDPFSGFWERDVNGNEKSRNNRLFCQNTRFNQEKTCQFSGLWLIILFATS
jgi:hypothetical protein